MHRMHRRKRFLVGLAFVFAGARLIGLSLENSSIVYLFPMLRLQFGHIGRRLSILFSPPLLAGILCPTSKVNGVTWFWHHRTLHLALNSVPLYRIQVCSRMALGILTRVTFTTFANEAIITYSHLNP